MREPRQISTLSSGAATKSSLERVGRPSREASSGMLCCLSDVGSTALLLNRGGLCRTHCVYLHLRQSVAGDQLRDVRLVERCYNGFPSVLTLSLDLIVLAASVSR